MLIDDEDTTIEEESTEESKWQGRKRTVKQRERDYALLAELYLKGYSMFDMARNITQRYADEGVDISIGVRQVAYDINDVVMKRWINSTALSFTEEKAKELAKLDNLETQYWVGWERSLENQKTIEKEESTDAVVIQGGTKVPVDRTKTRKTSKRRDGGIDFLDGVMRCIEMRCKIFGLFNPQKLLVDWRTEAVQSGFARDDSEASNQFEKMVQMVYDFGDKKEQE